jgi:hypothetical protein
VKDMADNKAEKQRDAWRRDSRQNRQSQSTAREAGGPAARGGSDCLSFFSLDPGGFSGAGSFDKYWWISAQHTAQ